MNMMNLYINSAEILSLQHDGMDGLIEGKSAQAALRDNIMQMNAFLL